MKKYKNVLNVVLIIALTAFALWFALKDDKDAVLDLLRNIKTSSLILVILFGLSYNMMFAILITRITRSYKKDYSFFKGIQVAFIGTFFNGVTPVGSGQIAQTYALHKQGFKTSESASILWLEFFIFQITMTSLIFIVFVVSLFFPIDIKFRILALVGYLINCSVVFILWTVKRFPRIYNKLSNWAVKVLFKFRIIKDMDETHQKWDNIVSSFTKKSAHLFDDKKLFFECVCLNIVRMFIYYTIPVVAAIALGIHVDAYLFLFIFIISGYIHMLNALTPLPGDAGFTETMFILLFTSVFASSTEASSVMLLWRLASFYVSILIGGIMFLKIRGSKREYLHDKEKLSQAMKDE